MEHHHPVFLADTVGHTPMVELKRINPNPLARVFVKLEYFNPSGSIKDRIARHIIESFEAEGKLKPGCVVVENSSGNTGAAVAMMCAAKGYKCVIVVPSSCSIEKQNAIRAFGAHLVICPRGAPVPNDYASVAKRIAAELPNAVRLDQYNNPRNVEAHYQTTGAEIWEDLEGLIDIFVCGASTGGTISGVGARLKKESNGGVKVVVADPAGSCIYNRVTKGVAERSCGKTLIEGIGKPYEVDCMHFDVIDEAVFVDDQAAIQTCHDLMTQEGIAAGGSSGANVAAALKLASKVYEPTTIVTVLPDAGMKYLSKYYNPVWLKENNFHIATTKRSAKALGDKTATIEVNEGTLDMQSLRSQLSAC